MKAPTIELKNVKHSEFASEETNCFEATVYVNGKRAIHASNDGRGGPDLYLPAHTKGKPPTEAERATFTEAMDTLNAYANSLPAEEYHGIEIQPNIEMLIGEHLTDWLVRRDVKRLLKSSILYVKAGQLYQIKRKATPEVLAHLAAKHPEYLVLNALTEDEAVEAYKQVAA